MDVSCRQDGNTYTIALDGWLDTSTASQLADALASIPGDVSLLVLDLASLEYISSAGLRQLAAAHKQMKGNLKVVNVSPEIMAILHMAGFDRRIDVTGA